METVETQTLDDSRRLLLEAVSAYRVMESGVNPLLFPIHLTRVLLEQPESDAPDVGLYLTALMEEHLGRSLIRDYLFAAEGTYPALARYLAADVLALAHVEEWSFDAAQGAIERRWAPPRALLDLAVSCLQAAIEPNDDSSAPDTGSHQALAVLVHGTFAASRTWWRPHSAFWQYVSPTWSHLYSGPQPYKWSGGPWHSDRLAAADALVQWAATQGVTSIDAIAHSHGGNVCLLAAKRGLRFGTLVLLGTPIRTDYLPQPSQIDRLVNIFSHADHVQTPTGTLPHRRGEGRTLADTQTFLNWRAEDNGLGSEPDHGSLHEPPTWAASGLLRLL